nr:MAG: hypothetical protein [Molluscum contagiosum virus]
MVAVEGRAQIHVHSAGVLDGVVGAVSTRDVVELVRVPRQLQRRGVAAHAVEKLLPGHLPDRAVDRGQRHAADALVAHVRDVREAAHALDLGQLDGQHHVVHGGNVLVAHLVGDHGVRARVWLHHAADRHVLRHVQRGLVHVEAEDVRAAHAVLRVDERVDDGRVHVAI